jgi:hypothetical protein
MLLPMLVTLSAQAKATVKSRTIYDIEVAPNDQWMAVTASSDDIWIYTLQGKLLRTLHHKPGSHLVDVEIAADGKSIVCTNPNTTGDWCPVWSTSLWKETAKVGIPVNPTFYNSPNSIEFAGGGKYVVGPTIYNHDIVAWDAQTGKPAYVAKKTRYAFYSFAVNPNSSLVVLYEGGVQKLRFWDFLNSARAKLWGPEIKNIDARSVKNMKFSHDAKRLFIITQPLKSYTLFSILKPVGGQAVVAVQDQIQNLTSRDVAWAGDDKLIWVSGLKGQIVCFDPERGSLKKHWTAHDGEPVHAIAATHRGNTLISSAGNTLCVWQGDTGTLIRTFKIPSP